MFDDFKLIQKRFMGSTQVHVNKNKDLTVITSSLLKRNEVPIDLAVIDPKPISYKNISIRHLVATTILGLISVLFLAGYFTANHEQAPIFLVLSLIVFIIFLFPLKDLYISSKSLLIYTNRHNGANLFVISPNRPSKEAVTDFISKLKDRIESIRYPENISFDEKIEIYAKHLEFLLNEGVLTEKEYNDISKRALSKNNADIIKMV